MANSTASVLIKPVAAFNRCDTFIFGSWVCTADDARSFQRRLTMTPNPSTRLVTLPEVVTGELAGKFGEISLYNQHADFELGPDSNSNSMSPWAIACEPSIEPSCADSPLHEHFPYGLCNASKAHAKALITRRAGKEIVSDYTSDSNPISGYYSDSSYEFDFGSDPAKPESKNLHDRATAVRTSYRPGYNIYTCREIRLLARPQGCRPDRRELTLRRLPRLASLPGGSAIISSGGAHSNKGGDYRLQSRLSRSSSLHDYQRDVGTFRDTARPFP
jgi:hypothetical protein